MSHRQSWQVPRTTRLPTGEKAAALVTLDGSVSGRLVATVGGSTGGFSGPGLSPSGGRTGFPPSGLPPLFVDFSAFLVSLFSVGGFLAGSLAFGPCATESGLSFRNANNTSPST